MGVVGGHLGQWHSVIRRVLEPVAREALGQPAAQANMQYSPQIGRIDTNDDKGQRESPEDRELSPEFGPLILLECIIEVIVPIIEANVQPNSDQVERDDSREQPDGRPLLLRPPIRPGKGPGLMQEPPLPHHRHHYLPRSRPACSYLL